MLCWDQCNLYRSSTYHLISWPWLHWSTMLYNMLFLWNQLLLASQPLVVRGHTFLRPSFVSSRLLSGFFINGEAMCNNIRAHLGYINSCPCKQINVINQSLTCQLAIIRLQGCSKVCLMFIIFKGQGTKVLVWLLVSFVKPGSKSTSVTMCSLVLLSRHWCKNIKRRRLFLI